MEFLLRGAQLSRPHGFGIFGEVARTIPGSVLLAALESRALRDTEDGNTREDPSPNIDIARLAEGRQRAIAGSVARKGMPVPNGGGSERSHLFIAPAAACGRRRLSG